LIPIAEHIGINFLRATLSQKYQSEIMDDKHKKWRELKKHIIQSASGTFGMRIWFMFSVLGANILLARWLGKDGIGTYNYVANWIGVLSIPVMFGLDRLVVREVAVYSNKKNWGLLRGFLRWSIVQPVINSLIIIVPSIFIIHFFVPDNEYHLRATFFIGLALIPLGTLLTIKQATLRGLHKILTGQVFEMFVMPMLFILFFVLLYFFGRDIFSPASIMAANVLTVIICLLAVIFVVKKYIGGETKKAAPEYNLKLWCAAAFPFVFVSVMRVINMRTDVLMLGYFKNMGDVGIYTIAARGSQFLTLFSMALNIILSPTIAKYHSEGNLHQLQPVFTKTVRAVSIFALIMFVIIIFFGQWYLRLNGKEFMVGKPVLVILSFGTFFNVCMGLVGTTLNMTGNQKITAIAVAISAVINIILNALFIPKWGIEGAAAATMISTLVWNAILVYQVRKRLKLDTTLFGRPPRTSS